MNQNVWRGLAAIILMFASTAGASERTWQKLSTVPYSLNNKQDAIAFADANRGWYGNGTGRIYRTDDAGAHWQQIWRHAGTYVRALEFADDKLGFLGNVGPGYFPDVKDHTPLYVTHDGGDHWTPAAVAGSETITGVCAIDVLKVDGKVVAIRAGGRVGGPAAMLESFDDGKSWQARNMSAATGMILDIHFVDATTGFIAGASASGEDKAHARILKTSDGGKSWRTVFESTLANDNTWKLAFPSRNVGYATIISYQAPDNEARGYVMKTSDGGEHWEKSVVTRDPNWIPYGIAFRDDAHGFVGGSTGGYETQDGGMHWVKAGMGLSVNKMRFVTRADGGTTVFAIGQDVTKLEMPKPR